MGMEIPQGDTVSIPILSPLQSHLFSRTHSVITQSSLYTSLPKEKGTHWRGLGWLCVLFLHTRVYDSIYGSLAIHQSGDSVHVTASHQRGASITCTLRTGSASGW